MQQTPVVKVEHLRKVYGSYVAVQDISLEVFRGEIFGMVGPNGAGKTTTIECIEGLRQPEGGQIRVLGLDPHRDGYALSARIGIQLQESVLPDRMKVWEALDLFAGFYPRSINWKPLLERLGLADKREAPLAKLSGGQKQRLFIALALVHDPEVVFLDELTTGLDPQARRAMWDLVRQIREQGKTVFLTTHYMEEAERLCDRVAIVDHGRVIALGSPRQLILGLGAEHIVEFSLDNGVSGAAPCDPHALARLPSVSQVRCQQGQICLSVTEPHLAIPALLNWLHSQGHSLASLSTRHASLEDVFVALTGRHLSDSGPNHA